jgi:hypothetical protein
MVLYCQRYKSERLAAGYWWTHFSSHPQVAKLNDSKADVYEVTVVEESVSPGSYWAWWDNGDQSRGKSPGFTHVHYGRGLVEMCFPHGTAIEERLGRGVLVPVRIVDSKVVIKVGDGGK